MPSVLIVDDDPSIRKLVATTLEDVAGFELVEAADGDEALELAREEAPAIVLLDIDMPGIDGFEACRRLRAEPQTADATVVMLTAAADEEAITRTPPRSSAPRAARRLASRSPSLEPRPR